VRKVVSAVPSISATGDSVTGSSSTYNAWIRGRPRSGFAGATVPSLTPTAAPVSAGIISSCPLLTSMIERSAADAGSRPLRRASSRASVASAQDTARVIVSASR
jgi:hypothetical protein